VVERVEKIITTLPIIGMHSSPNMMWGSSSFMQHFPHQYGIQSIENMSAPLITSFSSVDLTMHQLHQSFITNDQGNITQLLSPIVDDSYGNVHVDLRTANQLKSLSGVGKQYQSNLGVENINLDLQAISKLVNHYPLSLVDRDSGDSSIFKLFDNHVTRNQTSLQSSLTLKQHRLQVSSQGCSRVYIVKGFLFSFITWNLASRSH
jgi:hypothetical protein